MNTYFNEITSPPVNIDGGKILYKIPAGAFCSNGDLGVVFDNDEKGLLLHISKCDFWKFTPGAHKDGGIKTVGFSVVTRYTHGPNAIVSTEDIRADSVPMVIRNPARAMTPSAISHVIGPPHPRIPQMITAPSPPLPEDHVPSLPDLKQAPPPDPSVPGAP